MYHNVCFFSRRVVKNQFVHIYREICLCRNVPTGRTSEICFVHIGRTPHMGGVGRTTSSKPVSVSLKQNIWASRAHVHQHLCVWACVCVSLRMAHICSRMSKCVTALSPALIAFMSVTQNPFYFRVSSAHCVSVLVVANVGGWLAHTVHI